MNITVDKEILGAVTIMAIMANESDLVDAEMNIEDAGMKYKVSNSYDNDKVGFDIVVEKGDKKAHATLTTGGELSFEGDRETFLKVVEEATLAW